MKKIFLVIVLSLLSTCVFSQQYVMTSEGYVIDGQVKKSTGYATLRTYLPDGNELYDSVVLDKKGKFVFRGNATESMPSLLTINGKKKYRLYLEPKMQMELTIDPKKDTPQVKNAPQTLRWYSIVTPIKDEDHSVYMARLDNWVLNNPEDIFSADIIATYLSYYWTYEELSKHLNTLKGQATKVYYYKHLKERETSLQKISIGQKAPDITLQDLNGKSVNLKSFLRGKKYVLIDFWASWCKPCREEMEYLVSNYNTYKSKGFDIYGVSLDKNKNSWKKAVEDDNITWTTVSDLKMWESSPVKNYMIKSIPDNILVDASGNIVAKNLRKDELSQKLKELFVVESFKITGKIEGITEGVVKLTLLKKDGEKQTITERIHNGTFVFTGEVERICMGMIDLPVKDGVISFFMGNDNITINGNKKELDKVRISGSASQDAFTNIANNCNREKNPMQCLMNWVMDNPQSIYTPFIISNFLYPYMTDQDRADAIKSLTGQAKTMFQYHLLMQQLGEQEANTDMQTYKAKDFSLEDSKGNIVSLSSYIKQSKYTLVYFWASWDNNSRSKNIEYLKLYKQIKKSQLNFLSVSLDDSEYAWKTAIEKDGIGKWSNVSDLKRWNSVVVKLYSLKTIPYNMLLDDEGNILGKNLTNQEIINLIK
ncbi:MAG: redoxin domain-containing protein [Bacteroidales bacterium]|nr:redoxin domain-containing protein [Bacteroidales bacterium]